jgi:ABC-type microcin C transport system duplicated ATPase subunit YejF
LILSDFGIGCIANQYVLQLPASFSGCRPRYPCRQTGLVGGSPWLWWVKADPGGEPSPADSEADTIVKTDDLKVWFPIKKGVLRRTVDYVKAVDGITIGVQQGHSLGIVGESGSGKTTLGLAILRLIDSEGGIVFNQAAIDGYNQKQMWYWMSQPRLWTDPFSSR